MIYGPYEISQKEWDNWSETLKNWQEWYDELKDIMHKANWGAYEIPSHLRLYHVLTCVEPDGQVTYPFPISGTLNLQVYIIKDLQLLSIPEFKAKGGKK
jgi:hypothetical protein